MTLTPVAKKQRKHTDVEIDQAVYDIAQGTVDVPAQGPSVVNILKEIGANILTVAWSDHIERSIRLLKPHFVDGGDYIIGNPYQVLDLVTVSEDGMWVVSEAHTADDPTKRVQLFPETPEPAILVYSDSHPIFDSSQTLIPYEYNTMYRVLGSNPASHVKVSIDEDDLWPVGKRVAVKNLNALGTILEKGASSLVVLNVPEGYKPVMSIEGGVVEILKISHDLLAGEFEYDVYGDLDILSPEDPFVLARIDGTKYYEESYVPVGSLFEGTIYDLSFDDGVTVNFYGIHATKKYATMVQRLRNSVKELWQSKILSGLIVVTEVDIPDLGLLGGAGAAVFLVFDSTSFFSGEHIEIEVTFGPPTVRVLHTSVEVVSQTFTGNRLRIAVEFFTGGSGKTFSLSVNGQAVVSADTVNVVPPDWTVHRMDWLGWYSSSNVMDSISGRRLAFHDPGLDLTVLSAPSALPTVTHPIPSNTPTPIHLITLPLDGDLSLISDDTGTSASINGLDAAFGGGAQPLYADSLNVTGAATTVDVSPITPVMWDLGVYEFQIDMYIFLTGGEVGVAVDFIGSNEIRLNVTAANEFVFGDTLALPAVPFTPGQWNHILLCRTKQHEGAVIKRDDRMILNINGVPQLLVHHEDHDLQSTAGPIRFMSGLTGRLGAVRIVRDRALDPWGGGHQPRAVPF